MTYEEYSRILDSNPNARKFLNFLSIMEGTSTFSDPYRAQGGTNGKLLTTPMDDHPSAYGAGNWRYNKLTGGTGPSSANGKYAFIKGTWNGLKKQLGPNLKFDPRGQDIAALALIAQNGQLNNVLNGNIMQAINGLGGTWASLHSADQSKTNQHKRGIGFTANALKTAGFDPSQYGLNATGVIKGANLGNGYPVAGNTPQSAATMSAMAGGAPSFVSDPQQQKQQPDPLQQPSELSKQAEPQISRLPEQYIESLRNMDKYTSNSPINSWYDYWRKR